LGYLRKITTHVVCLTFVLSGCVTTTGSRSSMDIGPQLSSLLGQEVEPTIDPNKPKLDIVIPIFDPGLFDPSDVVIDKSTGQPKPQSVEEGVWPELRRAEANRFAYKLKLALEKTGAFGAVRVTPDQTATGDLYLLGMIEESDGEDVGIELVAYDITGARWFANEFDHEVDEKYHDNYRNKDKDPYEPLFEEVARYIVNELQYYEAAELTAIRRVTDLRFGSSFSEEAFANYLVANDGEYSLVGYPSNDDPMLSRTQAIRVRDQLFVDGLQDNYRQFSEEMELSYLIWQEQSQLELQSKRQAQIDAGVEAVGGVLLIGLAVLAIAAGAQDTNPNSGTVAMTGGMLAGAAGASLLSSSWQTSKEAEIHVDALEELGESIDMELAPQVIEFEEKTIELTGTAKEQFAQWRTFLKKIYAQESVPDVQL
jgi:hypothetical protein